MNTIEILSVPATAMTASPAPEVPIDDGFAIVLGAEPVADHKAAQIKPHGHHAAPQPSPIAATFIAAPPEILAAEVLTTEILTAEVPAAEPDLVAEPDVMADTVSPVAEAPSAALLSTDVSALVVVVPAAGLIVPPTPVPDAALPKTVLPNAALPEPTLPASTLPATASPASTLPEPGSPEPYLSAALDPALVQGHAPAGVSRAAPGRADPAASDAAEVRLVAGPDLTPPPAAETMTPPLAPVLPRGETGYQAARLAFGSEEGPQAPPAAVASRDPVAPARVVAEGFAPQPTAATPPPVAPTQTASAPSKPSERLAPVVAQDTPPPPAGVAPALPPLPARAPDLPPTSLASAQADAGPPARALTSQAPNAPQTPDAPVLPRGMTVTYQVADQEQVAPQDLPPLATLDVRPVALATSRPASLGEAVILARSQPEALAAPIIAAPMMDPDLPKTTSAAPDLPEAAALPISTARSPGIGGPSPIPQVRAEPPPPRLDASGAPAPQMPPTETALPGPAVDLPLQIGPQPLAAPAKAATTTPAPQISAPEIPMPQGLLPEPPAPVIAEAAPSDPVSVRPETPAALAPLPAPRAVGLAAKPLPALAADPLRVKPVNSAPLPSTQLEPAAIDPAPASPEPDAPVRLPEAPRPAPLGQTLPTGPSVPTAEAPILRPAAEPFAVKPRPTVRPPTAAKAESPAVAITSRRAVLPEITETALPDTAAPSPVAVEQGHSVAEPSRQVPAQVEPAAKPRPQAKAEPRLPDQSAPQPAVAPQQMAEAAPRPAHHSPARGPKAAREGSPASELRTPELRSSEQPRSIAEPQAVQLPQRDDLPKDVAASPTTPTSAPPTTPTSAPEPKPQPATAAAGQAAALQGAGQASAVQAASAATRRAVETARDFAPRLVRKVAETGARKSEIVLEPAELGKLRFELVTKGDKVEVNMTAERPETLDLLRSNVAELRQEFRSAGLDTGAMNFSQWGQGARDERSFAQLAETPAEPGPDSAAPIPPPALPERHIVSAGLDLRL